MFYYIDLLGTIAFAISGALAALDKRLDLFGIFIIAFVTAVGGGTLRDLLLGVEIVWMRDLNYFLVINIATIFTIFFTETISGKMKLLTVFDSIGLGVFTVVGLEKGLMYGYAPIICIALGTMTGCFGGVIRDILTNKIPIIFHKEIYATACILGGLVYFAMNYLSFAVDFIEIIVASTVVLIRLLSLKYQWELPNVYKRME